MTEFPERKLFLGKVSRLTQGGRAIMRPVVVFCTLFAPFLSGGAFARSNSISEDFILHCGSLYAMVSEAQALDHPDVAREYGNKYEILRKEIERKFEDSETGRGQAMKEIQDQVNELSSIIINLPPLIPKLISDCDESVIIKNLTEF